MIRYVTLAATAAGTVLGAPLATAQGQPPLEDVVVQGEILNRTIDQAAAAQQTGTDDTSNEIDGEAGIYVLTVNEIFFIAGSAGIGHTTNPTRTSNNAGEDFYGEFSVSAGVATRLGGAVDFSASLNVDGRDYFDVDEASSRGVSLTAAVGTQVFGPLYGSLVGFGGYAFDDQFDNETAFHGLGGSLSLPWRVSDQVLLRPGVGVIRQWSDVSENNSLSATASIDAIYVITPQWLLSGRASITQRTYDDFYEDVTFVEREDTLAAISASLVWRATPNLTVAGNVVYEDQDSTLFLSEFDAFETGLSLSLRHTF